MDPGRASRWLAVFGSGILLALASSSSARACSRIFSDSGTQAAWAAESVAHMTAPAACDGDATAVDVQMKRILRSGGIVFLGEVHDNERHHRLRAALLKGLSAGALPQPSPAFVFEHVREDQSAAILSPPETTDALFAALKWEDSGWPDKALFAPLFEQVLGKPFYAGEPQRGRVRDVARQGLKALSADDVSHLKLDVPFGAAQQDSLLTELEASHCGLMPKTAFATMAVAQRYRDAFMADAAMRAVAQHGSAIVFTGNGHARRDRGAPFALEQRGFDRPVLVVLFTESAPDKVDPAVADIVISTKAAVRKDPCEEMRARFGKKG